MVQPVRLRDPEWPRRLAEFGADVAVVVAFGQILPKAVLQAPARGSINVHASLLPRHRGAAPIAWSILAGDAVTGVTIMAMNQEMDAGDILLQRETPIAPDDTGGTLGERLARLGAAAIGEAIDGLQAGTLRPVPQPAAGVTFAPRIEREHCRLDWRRTAIELERQVRALAPSPSAFTTLGGKLLKVHRAALAAGTGPAGQVVAAGPDGLVVAAGSGALRLLEVQLEGRRRLSAAEFLIGHRLAPGTCLGAG